MRQVCQTYPPQPGLAQNLGLVWPNLGQLVTNFGQTLTKVWPTLASLVWPCVAPPSKRSAWWRVTHQTRSRPDSGGRLGELWPHLARVRPIWAQFGQQLARLSRSSAHIGHSASSATLAVFSLHRPRIRPEGCGIRAEAARRRVDCSRCPTCLSIALSTCSRTKGQKSHQAAAVKMARQARPRLATPLLTPFMRTHPVVETGAIWDQTPRGPPRAAEPSISGLPKSSCAALAAFRQIRTWSGIFVTKMPLLGRIRASIGQKCTI